MRGIGGKDTPKSDAFLAWVSQDAVDAVKDNAAPGAHPAMTLW